MVRFYNSLSLLRYVFASGQIKPSDVQLVHRYKWSAKEHESMYKILKEQNKTQDQYLFDLQSQLLDIVGELAIKTGS